MSDFIVREIGLRDLKKGLLDCLKELTDVGGGAGDLWRQSVARVRHGVETFIAVTKFGEIIGTVSVTLEPKFTHLDKFKAPMKARLEDLAVRKDWQGRGVAQKLIERVQRYASDKGCYKIDLSCSHELIGFYEKFGFSMAGIAMRADVCPSSPT